MRDVAQRADDLVIFVLEDGFRELQLGDFIAETPFDLGALVETPQRRQHGAFFEALEVLVLLHHLVNHVHDPGADGLHQHLRALALQEVEHVEIAVAFGGLRPEFAGDLDDGLHAQAVDFDLVERVAAAVQRRDIIVALQLVDELADILGGVLEAAQVFRQAVARASRAASCGRPRACNPWLRRASGPFRRH
jgi:hypothetical protein